MNLQDKRRKFLIQGLTGIGITVCAGTIATLLSSCESNETVTPSEQTFPVALSLTLNELEPLSTIGGAVLYNVPDYNAGNDIIIIRLESAKFLVVTSICTHNGCGLSLPDTDIASIYCGCHDARFSPITGEVIQQPNTGRATNLKTFVNSYDATSNVLSVYLPLS